MDKQPRDPAAPGDLLDVELHCSRAGCVATEIRVRIDLPGPKWLQAFREREWRCPLCRERATVRWMQTAAVTEYVEQLLRGHHREALERLSWQ
jgi:hypothetical protein